MSSPSLPSGRRSSPAAAWVRRHKLTSALVAVLVLGWTMDTAAGDEQPTHRSSVSDGVTPGGSGSGHEQDPVDDERPAAEPDGASREGKEDDRTGRERAERHRSAASPEPKPKPQPKPKPAEPERAAQPRTYLVTRVIDGDTVELGNGADVRIVGIDTPEVGQCGYDAATRNMARLVLGERVRLTRSDEDKDHYGRWLRYVDVGDVDAGLRQIRQGLAIARYDSRDGYGFHVREPRYVAADRASKARACPKPAPAPVPASNGGGGACAPGYAPCVPAFPPDVDCADVDGPVRVRGVDPHGLDADGDGVACE